MLKKIELLAFTNKVKIIKAHIPEKVKIYIENKLIKEVEYFQKKFSCKINFVAASNLIIPEYKIELLNKSKKVLNFIQNINKLHELKNDQINKKIVKKLKSEKIVNLKKSKKTKDIKKKSKSPRTLWVRRKKSA